MRSFIRACFRRPITVASGCILVVVLAMVSYDRLPVTLLPDIGYPAITVWTPYSNVAPERVEASVTEPLERAVSATSGLQSLSSKSQLGGSLIRLRFGWNTDLDVALLDVREQIDRIRQRLPEASGRPVVLRVDPGQRPIMLVTVQDGLQQDPGLASAAAASARADRNRTAPARLIELRDVSREIIARRIEQIDGVARVRLTGGFEKEVSISLNPDQLARYNLSLGQIERVLQSSNETIPAGQIRRNRYRYAVDVVGEFASISDIEGTIVSANRATPLRLRDIAEVSMRPAERTGLVRLDGREAILLLVERQPDANTVDVAERVRQSITRMRSETPDAEINVVIDESTFIANAITGVVQAVFLGGGLAVLVLFVFLRRRAPLVAISLAIPLSLAITLVLFDILGITFNFIALSGLALGVGLLLDNAIVVSENIARLHDGGSPMRSASQQGALQVAGAITASTLTTIAVFIPVTLVEGLAGRLFEDQSLAVVVSLLASLVVALGVVPLVFRAASRRGSHVSGNETKSPDAEPSPSGTGFIRSDPFTEWLMKRYDPALKWSLNHPTRILMGAGVILIAAAMIAWTLPRSVIPSSDQGRVEVRVQLQPGADLSLVNARSQTLIDQVETRRVAHTLEDIGQRSSSVFEFDPRPPYEADLYIVSAEGIGSQRVLREVQSIPLPTDTRIRARTSSTQISALLQQAESDLQIDLRAASREDGSAVVDTLQFALQNLPELEGVRKATAQSIPSYTITFDDDAIARFGVSRADVGRALRSATQGVEATRLRRTNVEIPVLLRERDVPSIEALMRRMIPTAQGLKPLSVFISAEQMSVPSSLLRSNQVSVQRILADIAPSSDIQQATRAIQSLVDELVPPRMDTTVGGANEAFRDSIKALGWSFLLSLMVVYLILAAQFEQLLQPLVILAAIPLAASGVAIVLWITGQSLNLMSLTGCIVLVGIVVNDAIIKVDFINQRLDDGADVREAIIEAGHDRLRPILMTTATTVLGLLPLATGFGQGAEIRAPLAIAIVGGLLSATVLILFVIPVLVQIVSHSDSRLRGRRINSATSSRA